MSEKLLLLSSAKSGVLLPPRAASPWWQRGVFVAGAIVVLVGAGDVVLRASAYADVHVPQNALSPLGTLELPRIIAKEGMPAPFVPVSLRIDSLQVNAPVEAVALKADGKTMASPKKFSEVAWYSPGQKPGESGNAVFAAHLNSPVLGVEGIFNELHTIKKGARVVVVGSDGQELTFIVRSIEEYSTAIAPVEEIFKKEGPSQIVLVTCEGSWDPGAKTFDKRLVVTAQLLPL